MKPQLENFKFATIKNVLVKVAELENKIEIRIEPLDETKEIEIYHKPLNHYGKGDFILNDNHKRIEINRGYAVGTYDGDIDWDIETIYPCGSCERLKEIARKDNLLISELRKKAEKLLDLFLNY